MQNLTISEVWYKQVTDLKKQLEEKENTIKKLRIELENLNYKKANQEWVEKNG
jgi:regulator of replication initiation timing|tara:strand:+ start:759 stop:917 length:159 start_codon:yes stop_codon:yes gene_type:complete